MNKDLLADAVNISESNISTSRVSNTKYSDPMIPRTLSPSGTNRRSMSPNASAMNESREKTLVSNGDRLSNSLGDVNRESQRAAMLSPNPNHKDYNRMKYYSAIRTGYAHLGLEQPSLEPPSHIIDKALFLF